MMKGYWKLHRRTAHFLLACCFAYSFSGNALAGGRATSELEGASVILVGSILKLSDQGMDELNARVDASVVGELPGIVVRVFEATASVSATVHGIALGDQVQIEDIVVVPDLITYPNFQVPAVGKQYVLFLRYDKRHGGLEGIHPGEFALEIEGVPNFILELDNEHLSVREKLRQIARHNVSLAKKEAVAARWYSVLADLYNPATDYALCAARKNDPRISVRGWALALLCQYHSDEENLYVDALRYLKDSYGAPFSIDSSPRPIIARLLFDTLKKDSPELIEQELRSWLASKDRRLQNAALKSIGKERLKTLVPDVVDLMLASEDELRLQCNCVNALSRVYRKWDGPAFVEFRDNRRQVIEEYKKLKDEAVMSP